MAVRSGLRLITALTHDLKRRGADGAAPCGNSAIGGYGSGYEVSIDCFRPFRADAVDVVQGGVACALNVPEGRLGNPAAPHHVEAGSGVSRKAIRR